MVLKESVFLAVNVLCSLVPCDVNYPYPETGDPDSLKQHFKIEYNGPMSSVGQYDFYMGHPIVWTPNGKLEGFFMNVVGGRKIYAFEGIPYAEDPVGQLRFRAPVPKGPWQGLYKATTKGSDCVQYNMVRPVRVFGAESCLFLNVYSPYIPFQGRNITKIPVIVWFHGGTFLHGSGSDFGPSYLLQNDVILVTVNYRLGVLGFMSTGDSASPGNWGLKDQELSLRWVNQNIESFGGDSSRVTIMGQGSSSVHLQMMSPRSKNLFHAAVSLSGTAFNYWSFHSLDEARNLTYYFGKMVSCPVHNGTEVLVNCLRHQNPYDLVQYQVPLLDDWFAPVILFRPTVEDTYQNDQAFLTESPEEAYKNNNVAKIPFIASYTAEEGLTFLLLHAVVGSIKMLRHNWDALAPDFLDYEQFDLDILEITRRIKWFYLKHVDSKNAPINTFADMIRDRFILGGVHKALQAHCQIAPTYSYVFNYVGKYNLGATLAGYKPGEWGAGHGEDVYYFFNSSIKYNGFKKSDPELVLSKIMVNLISNFAHKGEPIFTTEHGEDIRIWDPITNPRNISMLLIAKVIKMIPEPFKKNIHFWESLGLPDSQPLDFGNANPAITQYGNSAYNNGLGPNTQITITTPAPVSNQEDIQNQLPDPASRSHYNQFQQSGPNAFNQQRNPNSLNGNNNFKQGRNQNTLLHNNNFKEINLQAFMRNNAINQGNPNLNVASHNNNLNPEVNPNVLNRNNNFYPQQLNLKPLHHSKNLNQDRNPHNHNINEKSNFNHDTNPIQINQNNNFLQNNNLNSFNQINNFNPERNPNAVNQENNFNPKTEKTETNNVNPDNNFNSETEPPFNQDPILNPQINPNVFNQNININQEQVVDVNSQYDGEKPPEPVANPYPLNNEINQVNDYYNEDGEAKLARELDNSTNIEIISPVGLFPAIPDINEVSTETPPTENTIENPNVDNPGNDIVSNSSIHKIPPEEPATLTENENQEIVQKDNGETIPEEPATRTENENQDIVQQDDTETLPKGPVTLTENESQEIVQKDNDETIPEEPEMFANGNKNQIVQKDNDETIPEEPEMLTNGNENQEIVQKDNDTTIPEEPEMLTNGNENQEIVQKDNDEIVNKEIVTNENENVNHENDETANQDIVHSEYDETANQDIVHSEYDENVNHENDENVNHENDENVNHENDQNVNHENDENVNHENDENVKNENDENVNHENDENVNHENDQNVNHENDQNVNHENDQNVNHENDENVNHENDENVNHENDEKVNHENHKNVNNENHENNEKANNEIHENVNPENHETSNQDIVHSDYDENGNHDDVNVNHENDENANHENTEADTKKNGKEKIEALINSSEEEKETEEDDSDAQEMSEK